MEDYEDFQARAGFHATIGTPRTGILYRILGLLFSRPTKPVTRPAPAPVSKTRGVAKRPMKNFPLPEDVIEVILAYRWPYVPYDSIEFNPNNTYRSDVQWKALIAPFCLVSRAWLNPTRRVLYRTITEFYLNDIRGPLFWRTIENSPHMRTFVRQMYFRGGTPASLFSAGFNLLLPCCTVHICIPSYWLQNPKLLAESDAIGYLTFGYLLADPTEKYSHQMWTTGFQKWTRLEVLEFQYDPPNFPYDHVIQGTPLPSLRVIRFKNIRRARLPIPPTTANTLHTIVVSACDGESLPTLRSLLLRHSYSITHLFIGGIHPCVGGEIVMAEALASLQLLKTLIIRNPELLSDRFFKTLPNSLVDVSFSTPFSDESLNYCRSLFETLYERRRLKRVEMYSFGNGMGSDPNEMNRWGDIRRNFKKSGVTLSFSIWRCRKLPPWVAQD